MRRMAILLWVGCCFSIGAGMVLAQPNAETDRAALEAFYEATGGEQWTDNTNWMSGAPLGEWHGVTTDAAGRVTELYLGFNGLTGTIPDALGDLTNLEMLDLEVNGLTGTIPDALGDLANLKILDLTSNRLTGTIPDALGDLASLQQLWLYRNDFVGPIPDALGNLVNLEILGLLGNHLSGTIPDALRRLENLRWLSIGGNALTGPIPDFLGSMTSLEALGLGGNGFTGPVPDALGNLPNLLDLQISNNWGLSGTLPDSLRLPSLRYLFLWGSRVCVPASWKGWLETLNWTDGARLCGVEPDEMTMDIGVFYTPAARQAAGGTAEIEAAIDLMIAETNEVFAASAVTHRLALVARSEVPYIETGTLNRDLNRLRDPSDGYLDEVHTIRDRSGADLVHLLFDRGDSSGLANLTGPFGMSCWQCGGVVFAHEVGHNMGVAHDRFQTRTEMYGGGQGLSPSYGYVNQRGLEAGAPESSRWITIMAYGTQCVYADVGCPKLNRFSNSRHTFRGQPLGVPFGSGGSGVAGAADAAAYLNETGFWVAAWRDRPPGANQPPLVAGTLRDVRLAANESFTFDLSGAFVDPDGGALRYGVWSSSPDVVTVLANGTRVTVSAVAMGTGMVRVVATDPGGLSSSQSFAVTVVRPFTDHPIVPGVTAVRAVHFTELRTRIDGLRAEAGLPRFAWTDRALTAGVTPVRLVHLTELREALAAAYLAAGRSAPAWADAAPAAGETRIRAAHLMDLRAAVRALE